MNDFSKFHTQEKGRGWCLGLAGFCTCLQLSSGRLGSSITEPECKSVRFSLVARAMQSILHRESFLCLITTKFTLSNISHPMVYSNASATVTLRIRTRIFPRIIY